MSYKKQDVWTKCDECKRHFPKKSFNEHQNCSLKQNNYNNYQLKNGFVEKGVLFGKIEAIKNESLSEKRNIVILNPVTVNILGLYLGSLASLHVNGRRVVRKVWPSSQISLDCIGVQQRVMKNLKISENDIVTIHSIYGILCHANTVSLMSCEQSQFDISSQFVQYSTFQLENQFVIPGEVIEIPHYGEMKRFYVTSVAGDHGTFEDKNCDNDGSFVKTFSSLNINNDSINSTSDDLKQQNDLDGSELRMGGNISIYYSFNDESIHEHQCEKYIHPSDPMLTSTPRKATGNCDGDCDDEIICGYCLPGTVTYYISAVATQLHILNRQEKNTLSHRNKEKLSYDSIGGVEKQIKILKEMIELSIMSPNMFQTYGFTPPRGVLLYGPSGTGKSLLAKTVISESEVYSITFNGPDILSRYYGESEAKLRDLFQEAERNSPSIIFIDEVDALCPRRDRVQNEFEKRIVATLLTLMDGLSTSISSRVFVLAATNRPDSLDPALRRPGRFEREIEFGIPKSSERTDILMKLIANIPHDLSRDELVRFADNAHGYVGADLMAVVKEASMFAMKKTVQNHAITKKRHESTGNDSADFVLSSEEIREAFQHVRPSALREVVIDVPKVYWNDIGGNVIVKQKLKQAIEWPLKHPEAFARMNIDPPKGILMYGPPGCSKTLIAKALATESGLNFIAVKGPEIFSKWVGESEKAIRQVFRKARSAAPCIVFFDEIDAVAVKRGAADGDVSNVSERVLTQLLTELDGVETLNDVTLVAATNRPDVIDKALMRPGRIDRIIYIPLPDKDTRTEIFNIQLRKTPLADGIDLDDVVQQTEGYSGAEITAVCREAALAALQDDINAINVKHKHFITALDTIKPRTSPNLVEYYTKFQENCGIYSL